MTGRASLLLTRRLRLGMCRPLSDVLADTQFGERYEEDDLLADLERFVPLSVPVPVPVGALDVVCSAFGNSVCFNISKKVLVRLFCFRIQVLRAIPSKV